MLHGHILGSGLAKNWFEEVERQLNNHWLILTHDTRLQAFNLKTI